MALLRVHSKACHAFGQQVAAWVPGARLGPGGTTLALIMIWGCSGATGTPSSTSKAGTSGSDAGRAGHDAAIAGTGNPTPTENGGATAGGGGEPLGAGAAGASSSAGQAATGGDTGATGGRGGANPSGGTNTNGGSSAVGGAGGQAACVGAPFDASSPPRAVALSGNLGTHDPVMLFAGNRYYEFATGLAAKTSADMLNWTAAAAPFPPPEWARTATGATDLWAPDISYFGGVYHLYYAASTFGKNKSCIGQATRAALDTGSWTDKGQVICSNMGGSDNWNAIDPNVVLDDAGTPWLAFGSFWGGLKMVKLDATGARADTMLYSIAARPSAGGALEAPFVFKRCGYYYLFMSWDKCCQGADSTYNVRVGRSTSVTGPYVDKAGTQLMQGGGSLVVQGDTRWKGPGHNAVLVAGNATFNVYHSYDAQNNGASFLRISELQWDAEGWPVSGGP